MAVHATHSGHLRSCLAGVLKTPDTPSSLLFPWLPHSTADTKVHVLPHTLGFLLGAEEPHSYERRRGESLLRGGSLLRGLASSFDRV